MKRKNFLFIFLVLALALAACGGEEPTPTPQPPTPTSPPPTPTSPPPTSTPDETADFVDFESEVLGLAFSHPASWILEADEEAGEVLLASDDAALNNPDVLEGAVVNFIPMDIETLSLLGGEETDPSDPVSVLSLFVDLFSGEGEEEFSVREEPAAATINGQPGAIAVFDVETEEQTGMALIVSVVNEEAAAVIIAATTAAQEAEMRPIFDAVLDTVTVSPATLAEAAPVEEATAEAPAEEQETEAEPAEETAAETEPAATGPMLFPDLPTPELESGWSMYTNANYVHDIVLHDGKVWGATRGGLVAWDIESGELVRKWTTLDGLLHNVADAITVCPIPEERIVVGTEGGLSIYDPASETFENWTKDNSGMSSSFAIDTLTCVPHMQTLLIGYSADGVDVYDANAGTWTYYDPFDDLESGFAQSIAVVGDLQEIWVAHISGVSVIRPDGITFYGDESNIDDPDTDAFEDFVNVITVDNNGTVWFGQGGGLTRVDGDNQFTFFSGDEIAGWPFFSSVEGLAVGSDNTLWTNTSFGGVCNFDPASETCLISHEDESGMAEDFNSTLIIDENGHLYYASDGEGISIHDGESWTNLLLDELPEGNTYKAIAQGADGSIWVGGFYGGQRFYAHEPDTPWENLEDALGLSEANTFYPRPDGMWVGYGSGASFYEYESEEWTHVERAEEPGEGIYRGGVTAVAQDSNGRMWFGTYGGLTLWDGEAFTYYDLLNDEERGEERSPRTVNAVLSVGDEVWVGASGALFRFDANDEMTRYDDVTSSFLFAPTVYDLALDNEGNLLVAADDVLLQFDGDDGFDEIVEAESAIHDVLVTESDEMWLSVASDGVLHYGGSDWTSLTTADGLPSNAFSGQNILVDYLGTVWFAASEGGLARMVP